jgi:hypothetical protein
MTIALLGQAAPSYGGVVSAATTTRAWTTGMAIPVGTLITAIGFINGAVAANKLAIVSDSKNNPWTIRFGPQIGIYLADCFVQTALLATDTFLVSSGGPNGTAAWGGTFAYWQDIHPVAGFDKAVTAGPWSATANAPGAAAPATTANQLVIGVFGFINGGSTPSIATPGAGYTNQNGSGQSVSSEGGGGFDWESKIVSGPAATEQAGATISAVQSSIYGCTVLYRPSAFVFSGRNRIIS